MTTKTHALLSPSSAHRWAVCTPSARIEAEYPEVSSSFSKEGTKAHDLCEKVLSGAPYDPEDYDREMLDCALAYAYHIKDELKLTDCYVETKVEIPDIKDCFGTVDCFGVINSTLYVIDYKYGKGVQVSAYENHQMALYAYGLLRTGQVSGITGVVMEIFQPRTNTLSRWEIDPVTLQKWVQDHIVAKADDAYRGKGMLVQGDHCTFCKHRARCDAQYSTFYLCKVEEKTITENQRQIVLKYGDQVKDFIDAVKEEALKDALDGKKIEGYKVVAGRSSRTIPDYERAVRHLGGDEAQYYEKKPLGVTALQKLIGTTKMKELESLGIVVKPEGKPTLVPIADKREELITNSFTPIL